MSFAIHIPTTQDISRVLAITPEDPDFQSVVCLNFSSDLLPISRAYDSFVKAPTGVVEKHFGHRVFRADVSAPITDGKSWQLGLFLAHAAYHKSKLAERGDPGDQFIWATGEVANDLSIKPVDHIAQKIELSEPLLVAEAVHKPVRLFLHPENAGQIPEICRTRLEQAGVQIQAFTSVRDPLEVLGIANRPTPKKPAKATAAPGEKRPGSTAFKLTFAGLALMALAGASVAAYQSWTQLEPLLTPPKVEKPPSKPVETVKVLPPQRPKEETTAKPPAQTPAEPAEDSHKKPIPTVTPKSVEKVAALPKPKPQPTPSPQKDTAAPLAPPVATFELSVVADRATEGSCRFAEQRQQISLPQDARGRFVAEADGQLCGLTIRLASSGRAEHSLRLRIQTNGADPFVKRSEGFQKAGELVINYTPPQDLNGIIRFKMRATALPPKEGGEGKREPYRSQTATLVIRPASAKNRFQ